MFNSNQFDANAAFGGGFMPSQATQTTEHSSSPAKNRDSQGLLSVTVKQISGAVESSDGKTIQLDGVDVNNVTLVGIVFNKAEKVTDVSFVLDDGTGRIECTRWIHEAVDTREMERIVDGMYVRVHGQLKEFHGKKSLLVFSVRPLTEFDELTYHYVDCMALHNYNTRVRGSAPPLGMPNSSVNTPSKGYQVAPSNQYNGPSNYNVSGLDAFSQKVLDFLGKPEILARDEGIHVNDLARFLNCPLDSISSAITGLTNDGLVYSTTDEFHYRSTING